MKIIILDDDLQWNNKIKEYIIAFQFQLDVDFEIIQLHNIEDLYLYDDIQLLLLDIDINNNSVLSHYSKILQHHSKAFIIYITSYLSYMPQAFGLNVIKYIEKNNLKELDSVMRFIIKYFEQKTIEFKTDNDVYKFMFQEIYYIESINRKLYLYTKNQKIRIFEIGINSIIAKLPKQFVLINKQEIINLEKVSLLTKEKVLLKDISQVFYISRRKYKEVYDRFMRRNEENIYELFK